MAVNKRFGEAKATLSACKMHGMTALLWVMLGGAIGSGLRYGVGLWLPGLSQGFPWATLFVNLSGSLIIGVVLALVLRGALPEGARLFWAVGVLGGYTTFSSFSIETLSLLEQNRIAAAMLYSVGSLVLGLGAVWLGWSLGKQL